MGNSNGVMPKTIKDIQKDVGYPNLDALRQMWRSEWGTEEAFPKSYEPIDGDKVLILLRKIAVPASNRPLIYVENAKAAIESIEKAQREAQNKAKKEETSSIAHIGPDKTEKVAKKPNLEAARPGRFQYIVNTALSYGALNIVSVASAIYGFYLIAGSAGLVLGFLYTVTIKKAFDSAANANLRRERSLSVLVVVVMEVVAGVSHFIWSNKIISENMNVLVNIEWLSSYLAVSIAVLISGLSLYSIIQSLNHTKDVEEHNDWLRSIGKL